MIRNTFRARLIKSLSRVKEMDSDRHKQALTMMGCETENPSEDELKALFKSENFSYSVAEEVLKFLSDTIPPKLVALSEYWQERLDAVEGQADPKVLAKARVITKPENIHKIAWGKKPDISRFALYIEMTNGGLYDRDVGLVTEVSRREHKTTIAPATDDPFRKVFLDYFVKYSPDEPGVPQIREQIRTLLIKCSNPHEGIENLMDYIEGLSEEQYLSYMREFWELIEMFCSARGDHEGVLYAIEQVKECEIELFDHERFLYIPSSL